VRILAERDEHPPRDLYFDINAHFLRHHSYYNLAKITVYTKGRTPEETCQEILERVKMNKEIERLQGNEESDHAKVF
jgi:hypothetical protein